MKVSANITALLILVCALSCLTMSLEHLPSMSDMEFIRTSCNVTKYPVSDMEFIRTSCNVTKFPALCVCTLSSFASFIQKSPKNMAEAALNVTLVRAHRTSAFMVKMSRNETLNPSEAGPLRDCMVLMSSTVDEVKGSISELKKINGSNFEKAMGNIQTWVSAALTNEVTCSDGFSGKAMDGVVKKRVRTLTKITRIALALVNRYASLHHG